MITYAFDISFANGTKFLFSRGFDNECLLFHMHWNIRMSSMCIFFWAGFFGNIDLFRTFFFEFLLLMKFSTFITVFRCEEFRIWRGRPNIMKFKTIYPSFNSFSKYSLETKLPASSLWILFSSDERITLTFLN